MAQILVVDDEPYIRDVLARMLSSRGHEVDVATDGQDGCGHVEAREYDLVITDLRMPGMDGLAFLKAVHARVDSRTPCMILTAFDESRFAIEATRLGVCNFLVKPFEMDQLFSAVERALDIREAWTFRRQYEVHLEEQIVEIIDRFVSKFVDLVEDACEGRDHCGRLTEWSLLVAQAMDLHDEHLLQSLRMGALLHDIGKVKVGRAILAKRERLSAEDWEAIRRHPEYGVQMVEGIPHVEQATPVILNHHERYDGSGYPHGLRGEEIPLEARIFSVVDAFDCMIERRVYKEPYPPDYALAELRRGAGSQFDPHVVEAFERIYPEVLRRLRSNGGSPPVRLDIRPEIQRIAASASSHVTAQVARVTAREAHLRVGGNGRRHRHE